MLYKRNATVYVAARSEEKAIQAIDSIKSNTPNSSGTLHYLHLDLADLSTIKASVQDFLSKEDKLHVLFNNAGVMNPAPGSKTAQGYELQLGTNNIGPFMFTKLLTPILIATAKMEPPSTVRVVWVSSSAAEGLAPKGGVVMDNLDYHIPKGTMHQYSVSKAGNYFQGTEFAKRFKATGIVSVPLNPGNLNSDLWRTQGSVMSRVLKTFILHPQIYGAYTELFAGLSPAITIDHSGDWGKSVIS
jgi:retinol dehydrogenase 12